MIKQAIIPLLIVAIIASIILPMPIYLMDFLLVSNMVLALILLISTLYISDPLKLSSLPTILLLATLFRLALNISSTRLILSIGDAGKAIQAFGSLVIQDSFVVGAVVFLIITLVQFIVIAKGSERVAEVSARFTLDAMPGKQMSIDADVRAGLIDMDGARQKRQELQTESRFYGALDGAMKFIKGDAIAGIVICMINIIGGLSIGILGEGLNIQHAAAKYSMLTIGDGLISQLPALLNALAAGLVVTRVTRGDGKPLALEVLNQLGQVKPVKFIIAALCFILAWLPGVPSFPLLFLCAVLLISMKTSSQEESDAQENHFPSFQPRTPPVLQIQISKELAVLLTQVTHLSEKVDKFRQEIFDQLGIILPRPELAPLDKSAVVYKIAVRGIIILEESFNIDKSQISNESANQIFEKIISQNKKIVLNNASEFVDDILTRRCLDYFDKEAPELVSGVIPSVVSVTQLTFVLKALIGEGISIRNFDLIMQAVAESGSKCQGERYILEEVRISLKRLISEQFIKLGGKAVSLDPIIDLAFTKAEKGSQSPDTEYVSFICERMKAFESSTALIVSRSSRKLIKECLEVKGIDTYVLAFEELTAESEPLWVGTIIAADSRLEDKVIEDLAA